MVIFWSILIFIVALLALALLLPINFVFSADDDGIKAYLKILFIKKSFYPPSEPKKKKPKKKKTSKKPAEKKENTSTEKKKISNIIENVRSIAAVLGVIVEKSSKLIRVRLHCLNITVGSDEAAKTAVLYGAACSACDMLLDTLGRVWNFKARNDSVSVSADFLSEKMTGAVKVVFWTNVVGAIGILFPALLKYLNEKN